MKPIVRCALTFFCLFVLVGSASAQPFASLVDIPQEMEGELDAMAAQNSQIPSVEEVGFPPYPGAKVLFTQMNNRSNENGTWIDLPKRIFMGTSDSQEQVVEFYKKNLDGWNFGEFYGVPTFYKKEGEFKPMQDMITPRIVIAPEFRNRSLMPSSKTTIDIYYSRDH